MRILFIHLSDLHLRSITDVNETCANEIGAALSAQSIGDVNKILLLITGDIAFSGQSSQYAAFKKLKWVLIKSLKDRVLGTKLIHVFIVPGNHDIDYSYIENHDRGYYEDLLKGKSSVVSEDEIIARTAYLKSIAPQYSLHVRNPFFSRHIIDIDGFTIEVNLLNSTFFSLKNKNDQGLHYLPDSIISDITSPSGADMAISLMHHSHQWFNDICNLRTEQALLEKNTMIFYGHEHYLADKMIAYNGQAPAKILCGGCLCDKGDWSHSEFYACVYDTDLSELTHYAFTWDGHSNIYKKELRDKTFLKAKCSTDIPTHIREDFVSELLRDNRVRPSKSLEDYYVFPGLTTIPTIEQDISKDIFSFDHFYKELEKTKRIEISGGTASGKSAILKMIFKHYLSRKCVLLCKVDDISSGNRRRIIKTLFESTYGEHNADYEKFIRLDKSQKIILIDDIHLINPNHIAGFLTGIEEEFGYVVYTTSNIMKLDIEDRIKSSIVKGTYVCYQMLPLYESKRKELVNKMISLKNHNLSPIEHQSLSNKITHALNLQRRYIPLTPEIIMQFVEYYMTYQLDSVQGDTNIFNKVFESTISNALSPYVTGSLTVDKAFTILGKIAFYIHSHKSYPITHMDVLKVIEEYSNEYGTTTINGFDFIKATLDARILYTFGEKNLYKFSNNNYLAYFVAHEICANRDTDAVQKCLDMACFGINATILLFVTYLTHEERLIEIILHAASSVTVDWPEFSFGMKEISHLNSMILSEKDILPPSDEEKAKNKLEDEQKDRDEVSNSTVDIINIYEYNEEDIVRLENQVSRAASLLILLSRCLPNFEHRLKKPQKQELIRALYQLPNKIFYTWANEVEKCHDSLIELICTIETNEFTRQKYTGKEAQVILQQNSLSLLLEIYYSVANSAYRENTYEYLTNMAKTIVDFSEETHKLELLILLDKAKKVSEFIDNAIELKSDTKRPAALAALNRIVYHMLIKEIPNTKQSAQLKSEFFPKANSSAFVLQQKISKKKNS